MCAKLLGHRNVLVIGDAYVGATRNSPIAGVSNSVVGRLIRRLKRKARRNKLFLMDEFR